MKEYYSPLRYPGGKSKLTDYVDDLIRLNNLSGGHYVEPYAGGAGIALALLLKGTCSHIHLNDLNYPLFCFWNSAINETDELCKKINDRKVSIGAWKRQKRIINDPSAHSEVDIGYALFFLNRTNRSGIIRHGGVIGGLSQDGDWKMDARYNKGALIKRISRIAEHRNSISLYNQDAETFLNATTRKLPRKTLIYADPPYYKKGQRLYDNHYIGDDHKRIAKTISNLKKHWIVSYDNTPEIKKFYKEFRKTTYSLTYSAAEYYQGSELMIYSNKLELPKPNRPAIKKAA